MTVTVELFWGTNPPYAVLHHRNGYWYEVTEHVPGQLGTHDAEGWRTFQTPGDVCWGCSDVPAGRWVPVTDCPTALRILDQLHEQIFGEE